MGAYSLSHLSDKTLLYDLAALVHRDRVTTAELLAHLAEVEVRRLYAAAGHPSMLAYCVQELRLSEDSARKRIHAANTARRIPAIFEAVADGRLHLSAVILLAPWLSPQNTNELIGAATHRTKAEIEQLIADRFPRLDIPDAIHPIQGTQGRTVPGGGCAPGRIEPGPAAGGTAVVAAQVTPLSSERYALRCTVSRCTRDKLRYLQELLSHKIPSGDLATLIDRMADVTIREEEKRKFAATRPRAGRRPCSASPRHIPADVKRAVWERDQGQCTFVSDDGHRCSARKFIEFDHIEPVARGGQATVDNLRLRCSAHNQFEAECAFGAEFMSGKRERAREVVAEKRAKVAEARCDADVNGARAAVETRAKEAEARAVAETQAEAQARAKSAATEVIPWLRQLGFRTAEARQAAALCESNPDAPIEDRVRVALSYFSKRARSGRQEHPYGRAESRLAAAT